MSFVVHRFFFLPCSALAFLVCSRYVVDASSCDFGLTIVVLIRSCDNFYLFQGPLCKVAATSLW